VVLEFLIDLLVRHPFVDICEFGFESGSGPVKKSVLIILLFRMDVQSLYFLK
jgi:hypothetical protein